MLTGLVLVFEH